MGTYWAYRLAREVAVRLPARAAYGVAERVADARFERATVAREAVCTNLTALLGSAPDGHTGTARAVFRNFGRYLVELFRMHREGPPVVTLEGLEHLAAAQRAGRGVIVLTAHLGNWELGAAYLHRMGHAISAAALPHANARMDRLINCQRSLCGVEAIPLGPGAMREALRRLHDGRLFGVLGDWDFGGDGLACPMGRGTLVVARGPAVLSQRSGAPIVPMAMIREGPWVFRLRCAPPLQAEAGAPTETAVARLVQAYAAGMAHWVLEYPEQWLMFQPVVHER